MCMSLEKVAKKESGETIQVSQLCTPKSKSVTIVTEEDLPADDCSGS